MYIKVGIIICGIFCFLAVRLFFFFAPFFLLLKLCFISFLRWNIGSDILCMMKVFLRENITVENF